MNRVIRDVLPTVSKRAWLGDGRIAGDGGRRHTALLAEEDQPAQKLSAEQLDRSEGLWAWCVLELLQRVVIVPAAGAG